MYAELDETVYMEIINYRKSYWKLLKALYGLKQSGGLWNDKLNSRLTYIGFKRLKSEPCIYVKRNKHNKIIYILTVYIDEILIAGKTNEINKAKFLLKQNF